MLKTKLQKFKKNQTEFYKILRVKNKHNKNPQVGVIHNVKN